MKYITGTYALNLNSPTDTDGDWHYSSIDWLHAPLWDTEDSVYKDWGIYHCEVPGRGSMMVANHIRAVLDLIEKGYFSSAQGMREEFISNEKYTLLVFKKVFMLYGSDIWAGIDAFMGKEYLCDWLTYKEQSLARLHEDAIKNTLEHLNKQDSSPYVLKDDTALMLCYGLDRASEDIDLDALRQMKAWAYASRDKIRNLYDLTFIIDKYYDSLSDASKRIVRRAFEYKDLTQFAYLRRTQDDKLIDEAC